MGQKVNPIGLRLKITRTWDSVWYHKKETYASTLHEDLKIRKHIKDRFNKSGIVKVGIERFPEKVHVKLHSTKPGLVIGQQGKKIEALKAVLRTMVTKPLEVKIIEVAKPDGSAQALAESVALQLEDRMAFRPAR